MREGTKKKVEQLVRIIGNMAGIKLEIDRQDKKVRFSATREGDTVGRFISPRMTWDKAVGWLDGFSVAVDLTRARKFDERGDKGTGSADGSAGGDSDTGPRDVDGERAVRADRRSP